jgi:hypothetical protein
MTLKYKGHSYRISVQGKASEVKGYHVESIFLWIDDVQIKPGAGSLYEPYRTNGETTTRQAVWDHVEKAAMRIIDHLVATKKTIHEP